MQGVEDGLEAAGEVESLQLLAAGDGLGADKEAGILRLLQAVAGKTGTVGSEPEPELVAEVSEPRHVRLYEQEEQERTWDR